MTGAEYKMDCIQSSDILYRLKRDIQELIDKYQFDVDFCFKDNGSALAIRIKRLANAKLAKIIIDGMEND